MIKASSLRPPPNSPPPMPTLPADGSGRSIEFRAEMSGVPVILRITARASTDRESLAAAWLVADAFCEWARTKLTA